MKSPKKMIDIFCYKHPNFGIPDLMKYIAIGNVVFWIIGFINPVLISYLPFSASAIMRGQVWRIISFVFYPPSFSYLAFIAIYFYYMIGSTLERYWGTAQFTMFILISVILTELYAFIVYFVLGISLQINAEYIYLSMFFAFAALFPDLQVLLFFIIPIKMKYLAYVDAAFFVLSIIRMPFPINLLPAVAILNLLIFFGADLWKARPRRDSNTTINFRKESRKIRQQQAAQLYKHKCAVCGKTDADYPNMEFRYCSKCAGYHCFCEEHIFTHIHFTEE